MDHTALLLIDIQKGFIDSAYWGISRSNPHFERNVTSLLEKFRRIRDKAGNRPLIVHVYHESTSPESPLYPSSPGVAFQDFAQPQESREIVISKSVHSAFIGTSLEETLRTHGIRRLYVVGLVADHCVSTTVRMACDLKVTGWVDEKGVEQVGEGVFLVEDATAAFGKGGYDSELVHAVHVESLKEFATIVKTDDLTKAKEG